MRRRFDPKTDEHPITQTVLKDAPPKKNRVTYAVYLTLDYNDESDVLEAWEMATALSGLTSEWHTRVGEADITVYICKDEEVVR